MELSCDVCVIGGGVIGGFVASKFIKIGKSVAMIESSNNFGGQTLLYNEKKIYNLPLFEGISAFELRDKIEKDFVEKENFSFFKNSDVQKITKIDDDKYKIAIKTNDKSDNGTILFSKYVIFATGKGMSMPNKLNIQGANECEGKTLFYDVKNKDIFRNKTIAITGGGDSVLDWSVELSGIAKKIFVVSRRQIVKVENQQFTIFLQACENGKIEQKFPFSISEIYSKNGEIDSVLISNNENVNEKEKIDCDCVLAFLGLKVVKNNLFEKCEGFSLEERNNFIVVNQFNSQTNEKNIFAVGDCCFYEGKLLNIPFGFFECLKCFYAICKCEDAKFNIYEKR